MTRVQTKQTFKLRLLALVLAVALVWYSSINPAPRIISRIKRDEGLPDEKKREAEPGFHTATIGPLILERSGLGSGITPSPSQDEEDDFEWPELIDG